ncbi:hypothetical protein [Parachlamydia acanthamoebae]|uniref:Uncharacterized protein n=1 Tax=Parachlamydia acanthamoebae TaxID=83552 RepID=A0A0C1ELW6_9BACT|nr:hypothetical protein [Parachlamydia acanthamoebae]KIA77414.1 hypothetical protein DB43_GI00140 [Parachlamydia acanthamoebae]
MPNAIFTDRPFHYSCMEGDKEVKREISTKAKVAIIAIAILASPFVLFFGAVPLFFLHVLGTNPVNLVLFDLLVQSLSVSILIDKMKEAGGVILREE